MQQSSFYKGLDGIKSVFWKANMIWSSLSRRISRKFFMKLAVKNPNLNIRLEMNSGLPNDSRVLSSFWTRADIDMAFVLIAFTFSDSHV